MGDSEGRGALGKRDSLSQPHPEKGWVRGSDSHIRQEAPSGGCLDDVAQNQEDNTGDCLKHAGTGPGQRQGEEAPLRDWRIPLPFSGAFPS